MTEKQDSFKINFNAGPAALPQEVLQQASEAVLNFKNTGLSVLEIPHRGKLFGEILEESKALVDELCCLKNNYEILWLQGGGRLQFCMIPMNFLKSSGKAGFIQSGHWAAEAEKYAGYYGRTQILSSSKENNYNRLPDFPEYISGDFSYIHITTNNTVYGTQIPEIPESDTPLIADMSSDILSRKTDYDRCALFYAVAQKNLGAAGNTLVAIRKDFLEKGAENLPPMLSYREHAIQNSILNTPPVFSIYLSLLTLRWIKQKTLSVMEAENRQKAALLYQEIERNTLFRPLVPQSSDRSIMNLCFRGKSEETEKGFLDFCNKKSITGIKGHRRAGGFRVSLYNAVSLAQVKEFIAVMEEFEFLNNKA